MNYCVLRAKKLSTFAQIASSAKHTFREIDTPNADPARTPRNPTIGAKTANAVCAEVMQALPAKRRKDAVICIEYLFTASRLWFDEVSPEEQILYFNAAVGWLQKRHGSNNIVCLNIHRDETTPHLVAFVIPYTQDGRLCAKDFLGGRAKLRTMQADYASSVGAPFRLCRGIEGTKARHTSNKAYNAALLKNPTLSPPKRPKPTVIQKLTGEAAVMSEQFEAEFQEYARLVEQARGVTLLSQHANASRNLVLAKLRAEAEDTTQFKAKAAELAEENNHQEEKLRQLNAEIDELRERAARALAAASRYVKDAASHSDELRQSLAAATREASNLRSALHQALGKSEPDGCDSDLSSDFATTPANQF